ncbi:MAG: hypothetical protein M0Z77_05000 [Thermoplasmatales archaeon]|nr:hypothetical protein [Thermoplasmatales archaeon]
MSGDLCVGGYSTHSVANPGNARAIVKGIVIQGRIERFIRF